ncbi:MAG: radical SAM/SPASM domain-containing protein [Proteobacteria bacterium]|nr:radical SAM/SPASM domain-containing protein [Pseudomonadota bacterium]
MNKKRRILIVSGYKNVNPCNIGNTDDNYFALVYPDRENDTIKYDHFSESSPDYRFGVVYPLKREKGIKNVISVIKELLKIKRDNKWDAVYFFNPDSNVTLKLYILSFLFYPDTCFMFDMEYKISKINLSSSLSGINNFSKNIKKIKYWYPAAISRKIKLSYNIGMPSTAIIENTNVCDQRCPICETGLRILERPRGFMGYDNFCKVIDKIYKYVQNVSIYYMGEPFLDKDIYRMIKYAKEKGLRTTIATNGNFLDIDKLFWSGLDNIDFKMSGMDAQSHDKYRVGGSLDNVIKHVKLIIREKRVRGKLSPYVGLGFIVMKHNEHQKQNFLDFAKDLDVNNYRFVKTCIRTVDQGIAMLPEDRSYWIYDENAFDEGRIEPKWKPDNACGPIYHQVVITWQGDVLPCCRDVHGHHVMGNIFEDMDFRTILNNKKYIKFRKLILTNQKNIKICSLCQEFASYE